MTADMEQAHKITETLTIQAEGYQNEGANAATIALGYLGAAVLVGHLLGVDHADLEAHFREMLEKAKDIGDGDFADEA